MSSGEYQVMPPLRQGMHQKVDATKTGPNSARDTENAVVPVLQTLNARAGPMISIPGFIGQLQFAKELGLSLSDPRTENVVSESAAIDFLQMTNMETDAVSALIRGDKRFSTAIAEGMLDRIFIAMSGLSLHKNYPVDADVMLPIAELHCPHIAGCETEFKTSSERNESLSVKLSIARHGVGGGYSNEILVDDSVKTSAECVRLYKRANFAISEYRSIDGRNVLYYLRIIAWRDDLVVETIDDDTEHLCADNFATIVPNPSNKSIDRYNVEPLTRRLEAANSESAATFTLRTGRLMHVTISVPLPPDCQGISKAAITIASDLFRSTSYRYKLVGPANYIGYYVGPERSNYQWSWTKLQQLKSS